MGKDVERIDGARSPTADSDAARALDAPARWAPGLPLLPAQVLALQRTAGNAAVCRMMAPEATRRILVEENGEVSERVVAEDDMGRYRPVSAQRWRSAFLPAALNTNLGHVYEEIPRAEVGDASQIGGTERTSLHLKWVDLVANKNQWKALLAMRQLERLELSHCTLPAEWPAAMLQLPKLTYLAVYSPKKAATPSDNLESLRSLPLQVLRLVQCSFMTVECYRALTGMNLAYLDLNRTVTKEKAPGTKIEQKTEGGEIVKMLEPGGLDRGVMEALKALAHRLETLNVKACSALTEQDKAELQAGKCQVEF
ncbi:hypothetical protein DVA67_025875 [Solirubrobacter sp. CPCC 204708]|uniref:Leucine-rich repeat domain-containing protein n=1 Tax=Solirubrobacter deserti TaxID=2282478 RepID=A0ABT4RFY0_9ACTN|nr:hypothetical protein [Solirubrobacter deserti]MBE2319430.1 hypothetical protein [Solirubrobacter deserti]MDA0137286.1 hypothetical protein [Solirubrobacter deserti]